MNETILGEWMISWMPASVWPHVERVKGVCVRSDDKAKERLFIASTPEREAAGEMKALLTWIAENTARCPMCDTVAGHAKDCELVRVLRLAVTGESRGE